MNNKITDGTQDQDIQAGMVVAIYYWVDQRPKQVMY